MASPVSPAGPSQAPGDDGSAAPVVEPPSTHPPQGSSKKPGRKSAEGGWTFADSMSASSMDLTSRTGGGSSRSSKPSLASTTSQMPATGTRLQGTMR
ncbi:hypothetical protein ACOMHN_028203 [Nucella lapillus]